jgi:RNA polymerase sigma factor (sigma-70 family)
MEDLRPLLTVYAYNILGSFEDARDIVQDTFLKFSLISHEKIIDRKSYLVRMTINLAIDQKRKQKKLRAKYPGEWLPEPVATEDSETAISRKEILSYSLMVLLEKLSARQRAVFILKEAFDYEHEEIAAILGITVESSRKTLSRARQALQADAPSNTVEVEAEYLDRYIAVIQHGDIKKLEQLLNEEAGFIADGGGKVQASINPVYGKKSVLAMLSGLNRKFLAKMRIEKKQINHQPALLFYEGDRLVTCQIFTFTNGRIANVFLVRNPDKLRSL